MQKVNVHEARANLSHYLDRVQAGETVLVCRRNVPIAELRPVSTLPSQPRVLGQARGSVLDMSRFAEPLPDWLLQAFEGGTQVIPRRRRS